MPTHESAIVTAAKRLARAQERRRKARREMKALEAEIRTARKELRAVMVSALRNPDDQLSPRNARVLKARNR